MKRLFDKPLKYVSIQEIKDRLPNDSQLTPIGIDFENYMMMVTSVCKCGNETRQRINSLIERNKSCERCAKKRAAIIRTYRNPEHKWIYSIMAGMRDRCYNENTPNYLGYGARGIRICDEWLNSYQDFVDWALVNGVKKGLKIDRINNDGNYEPSNCRFVTNKVNCNNTRKNRVIEYMGIKKTVSEWIDFLGIDNYRFKFQFYKQKKSFEQVVEYFNKQHLFT